MIGSQKLSNMHFYQLKTKVQEKFKSLDLEKFAHQIFFVKPYKIKKFCFKDAQLCYEKLYQKYQDNLIQCWPKEWHKHQRKLFIEIFIWYCKLHQTIPLNMNDNQWEDLSQLYFNKNPNFLKFQGLSLLRITEKIAWGLDQDKKLSEAVKVIGEGNWNQISKYIFFKSDCQKFIAPKQCRQRWFNHLSQKICREDWTEKQDQLIIQHVQNINKRWCEIVKKLNYSRTEHMVKNRYFKLIKKSYERQNYKTGQKRMTFVEKSRDKIKKSNFTEISGYESLRDKQERQLMMSRQKRRGKSENQLQLENLNLTDYFQGLIGQVSHHQILGNHENLQNEENHQNHQNQFNFVFYQNIFYSNYFTGTNTLQQPFFQLHQNSHYLQTYMLVNLQIPTNTEQNCNNSSIPSTYIFTPTLLQHNMQ